MSKDTSLLLSVSDLFTEETLKDILRKITGKNEVKISSWEFGEASNKGESYLSIVNRIKVKGEAAGKPAEISLVVKSMSKVLARRTTFRSSDFFYNEITCYTEIFPKFREFIKSKNQENFMVIPRCLAALTDGENDFLVLEDVSCLGFGPVTRQSSVTLSESSLILKALARFHAISFAYKDQKKEEFQQLADKVVETYWIPRLYDWYKGFQTLAINAAKDALAKEYPGSKGEERFNSLSGQELYNYSVKLCARKDAPTSIISQGDSWAPNFLICKSDGDNDIALMLDFQLARCGSPVLDISHFVYSCTEKPLRDNHYEELLKIYHDELSKSIGLLGSDPKKLYPWDIFMKEVQEQSKHGINCALEAIPGAILDVSEAYDMDAITGDKAIDVAEIWAIEPIKSKEGRRRLADVIVHAVENNYL